MSGKRIKGAAREVWGILNPYGDVWGTDTFETPELARKHIADFWSGALMRQPDLSVFKVVKVRVRVTAILPVQQPATLNDGGEAVQQTRPGLDQKEASQ